MTGKDARLTDAARSQGRRPARGTEPAGRPDRELQLPAIDRERCRAQTRLLRRSRWPTGVSRQGWSRPHRVGPPPDSAVPLREATNHRHGAETRTSTRTPTQRSPSTRSSTSFGNTRFRPAIEGVRGSCGRPPPSAPIHRACCGGTSETRTTSSTTRDDARTESPGCNALRVPARHLPGVVQEL